jgi:tetratricopeptide (TPR) repeat protein
MSTPRNRRLFWLVTLSSPFLLLILLETGLRLGGYGHDLSFVRETGIGGREYYSINPEIAWRYFLGSGMPPPKVYDDVFLKVKTPSTFRIFCLGESTMEGFPYEYNGALPRLLYDRLHLSFPARNIEVINLGITAISSAAVTDIMREVVRYEPDLVIVYTGHNEFYGALGTASLHQVASADWILSTYLRLTQFRTFQLSQHLVSRGMSLFGQGTANPSAESMMEFLAAEKVVPLNGDLYSRTRTRFQSHLNELADIASSNSVQLILSTTVSNIRDMAPFVSITDTTLDRAVRDSRASRQDSGKVFLRNGDMVTGLRMLMDAWRIDSSSAVLAFDIAGCFDRQGDSISAKRFYERARDLDALRFRATSGFNETIRSVCRERNLVLADVERSFEHASEGGIIGRSLVLEHVHPNIDGYFLMASTFADAIGKTGLLRSSQMQIPIFPDEVYKSLAMMTMFDFEVSFFRLDILLHRWPFSEPESTRHSPVSEEGRLARDYINRKITWEQAHYSLGSSYVAQRRYPEAIREYLALAKVYWYDYQPLMYAGDQYLALGGVDEARSMYGRALARERNSFVLVRMGAAFAAASAPDSAIAYFREALGMEDALPARLTTAQRTEVLFHLSEMLALRGRTVEAEKELDRLFALNPDHDAARALRERIRAGSVRK